MFIRGVHARGRRYGRNFFNTDTARTYAFAAGIFIIFQITALVKLDVKQRDSPNLRSN